jgi:hypothetical protein
MPELKPRTTTVILFQGDDLDPLAERLEAVPRAASGIATARMGDVTPDDAARAYNDFMEGAEERAAKITLKALGRKAWRDLVVAHPPAEGDDYHQRRGFNVDTLGDDLVPASIVEGQFPSIADRDAFLDALCDADFSKLYSAAVALNESVGPDPKARLPLQPVPTSDETSESPARSGEA